jgi:hypothetical protein
LPPADLGRPPIREVKLVDDRAQAGDERYAWVNQTVFVGQGRIYPGSSVQYRVYRVN